GAGPWPDSGPETSPAISDRVAVEKLTPALAPEQTGATDAPPAPQVAGLFTGLVPAGLVARLDRSVRTLFGPAAEAGTEGWGHLYGVGWAVWMIGSGVAWKVARRCDARSAFVLPGASPRGIPPEVPE